MKKLLFFLCISIFVLTCALAESPEWTYSWNCDGVGLYNGAGGDVTVPETAGDKPVHAVGDAVFARNPSIVSLTIPGHVRSLGGSAINGCDNLERVTLAEGLQAIEYNNFASLPKLTELTIPSTVALIDYSVSWCDNLRTVTFLGACPIFSRPEFCFDVLPEDLTVYVPDDQLEAYRAALVNLNPDQIQPSGQNAIVHDYVPAPEELGFADGVITAYNGGSLRVDLPAEVNGVPVTAIGAHAFEDSPIVAVTIPEGVTEIGSSAFDGADELHFIQLPDSLRTIGDHAFNSTEANMVTWGKGLEEIGDGAFRYVSFGENLELPESLTRIGREAFKGASLRNVHIGGGIQSIGANAFDRTNLNYLQLDVYDMIEVGENAFAGTRLEDVDLPWDSTQENQLAWQALIDSQVEGCKVWINNPEDCELPVNGEFTYEEYPDGTLYLASYSSDQEALVLYHTIDGVQVTGIGDGAFKGNQTLKKYRVTHNDTFKTIGAEAFAGSGLETVDLYYTTETLGDGAFRDCVNLTAVVLPESLKSVGSGAFAGCVNLLDVTILCDPAILPADAFEGTAYAKPAVTATPDPTATPEPVPAAALIQMPFAASPESDFEFNAETGAITGYYGSDVDVVIPREIGGVPVKVLDYNAFDCARDYTDSDIVSNRTTWLPLRSVVIPETVEVIEDSVFSYCQQLELVVCYAPLKSTGRGTFMLCRNLREVIFVNGVDEIDNYCFNDCGCLERVYWGDHLERIGVGAFQKAGIEELTVDARIVDEQAFWASKLQRLTLTDRVREIKAGAFYMCESLNYVAAQFSDAGVFVDGGPFGGVPQSGVTTVFPAETTEEQLKDMNRKLNIWNGGHLGNGNEITLAAVDAVAPDLPDVETLYQQVTSAPLPESSLALLTPAETEPPVLTAFKGDTDALVGVWKLRAISENGQEVNVSLLGIDMSLILNEDGTGMTISEDAQEIGWKLEDGVLYIGSADEWLPAALEEGRLILSEDGAQMIFVNMDVEETPVPATAEDVAPYVGEWHCIWVDTVVMSYNPEKGDIDDPMTLVINPDGTAYFDEYDRTVALIKQNGVLFFEDLGILPIEDGHFLCANNSMYFSRDRNEEVPEKYRHAARDAIYGTEPTPQPAAEPNAAPVAPGALRMDVKYLATSYAAGGYSYDAGILGAEYSAIFHEDGTCQFVMGGFDVPGVTWSMDGDTININYALGYPCTLNGDALELDFSGAMLLHMEPQL